MVADPGLDPFTVTEQLPDERVHVVWVKETEPGPVLVQATVPVGVGVWPPTVAVHVVVEPKIIELAVHDTVVVAVALMYGVP